MRVRDHVVLSSVGAVLLYPRLRGAVLGPWAASILIDADHYLWFCRRQRRLSPVAAMRYFNQAQPPRHRRTRLLHSPVILLGLLLLTRRPYASARQRTLAWVVLGMAFHVGLDTYDTARRERARAAALARDGYTCQHCGAQGPDVVAHLWSQPWLLPSYRPAHVTSLCGACHEAAHGALLHPRLRRESGSASQRRQPARRGASSAPLLLLRRRRNLEIGARSLG